MLFQKIETFIHALRAEGKYIPPARKTQLRQLAGYIRKQLQNGDPVHLNFICTHNSRRSLLGQIWAGVAASYFGINSIRTYSGGTEVTAVNPRVIAALERVGFRIQSKGGDNPRYQIRFSDTELPLEAWSKTYDDTANPQRDFAAIMTCSDADENCPFIPGAAFRLPLTYEDPKVTDGTPEESLRYDERTRQIGRELFWMMELVAQP